jgi:hypothetical protein
LLERDTLHATSTLSSRSGIMSCCMELALVTQPHSLSDSLSDSMSHTTVCGINGELLHTASHYGVMTFQTESVQKCTRSFDLFGLCSFKCYFPHRCKSQVDCSCRFQSQLQAVVLDHTVEAALALFKGFRSDMCVSQSVSLAARIPLQSAHDLFGIASRMHVSISHCTAQPSVLTRYTCMPLAAVE